MELEGDSPAPRPPVATEPAGTQNIHVTPENVVALAALFRDCADRLAREVPHIEDDMRLKDRWMGDPISGWAQLEFNEYFADGHNAFAKIVQAEHGQHVAMRDALVATAKQYGLTDDLIAAGFTKLGPAT